VIKQGVVGWAALQSSDLENRGVGLAGGIKDLVKHDGMLSVESGVSRGIRELHLRTIGNNFYTLKQIIFSVLNWEI
jgi:hypothetical protein